MGEGGGALSLFRFHLSHFPWYFSREGSKEWALSVVPHFSLSPPRLAFLVWDDVHGRLRFAVPLYYPWGKLRVCREKWLTSMTILFRDFMISQRYLLKGCVTAVQFILFNFANYSTSIAMELEVSKKITCKWQNQRSETNKCLLSIVLLETLPFTMVSSHIETVTTWHRRWNHNYVSVQTTFLICKIKLQNRGWQFYSEPLGQKWNNTYQT